MRWGAPEVTEGRWEALGRWKTLGLGQQESEILKNPEVDPGGQYNAFFVLNVFPNSGFRPLGVKSEVFKKVDFFYF